MSLYLVMLIPILFGAIHMLEFTAILARIAGINTKNNVLGYSIQQAVYVGTRLFSIMLLPVLGLIVDRAVPVETFQMMAIFALLAAALASAIVFALKARFVRYFQRVILAYVTNKNFIAAFFVNRKFGGENSVETKYASFSKLAKIPGAKKIMIQSALVYAVYGTGIFLSFYFALLTPEYRASISQLSGIVNAFGAVLLTFFIEPRISRGIDANSKDAPGLVIALLLGRLFGVAVLSQIVLATVFWLT
ncbi:MAG: lipid II flippase Amj family protein [Rhodobacteraceae bacterium]|nr:lipid II flippase Amj family protein [Paracoccaceae bacterium]